MNAQLYQALLLIRHGVYGSPQVKDLFCFKNWEQMSQDIQELPPIEGVPEAIFSPMQHEEATPFLIQLLSALDFLAHEGQMIHVTNPRVAPYYGGPFPFKATVIAEVDFGSWETSVDTVRPFYYRAYGSQLFLSRKPGWEIVSD